MVQISGDADPLLPHTLDWLISADEDMITTTDKINTIKSAAACSFTTYKWLRLHSRSNDSKSNQQDLCSRNQILRTIAIRTAQRGTGIMGWNQHWLSPHVSWAAAEPGSTSTSEMSQEIHTFASEYGKTSGARGPFICCHYCIAVSVYAWATLKQCPSVVRASLWYPLEWTRRRRSARNTQHMVVPLPTI